MPAVVYTIGMSGMHEVLYQYNPWWENEYQLGYAITRPLLIDMLYGQFHNRQIIFLTGLRRIGKTTLLKLFIRRLIEEEGIAGDHVLYVSVDDYLLKDDSLLDIVTGFRQIHRLSVDEKVYLFFDEVTYQPNFQQQLKTLLDRQDVKIFASSSSGIRLRDRGAFLTGRGFVIEVPPLDFDEYLQFRNIDVARRDRTLLEPYFAEFMQTGGIPYYVLHGEREYLSNLIDDIIYKDIVAQFGIKNVPVLRDFFLLLMERSGKQVSINKLANILKISPDSAKRYLGYFQDTFLIGLLSRFGTTNEKNLSPKKIYCADLGMKHIFTGLRDLGSLFENYIYLLLKKFDVYYIYERGTELDFYLRDEDMLIEAKYNSRMNAKQQELYEHHQASRKMVLDSVYAAQRLAEHIETGTQGGVA